MSVVEGVKIPDSLFNHVRRLSEREGITVEQFVASAIAERASAWDALDYLKERAANGSRTDFEAILAKVPDVEPDPEDRLD